MKDLVYQFHIKLLGIEPMIWRRIQVPAKFSFWDLHVAIQDSMGWLDYHLHAYRVRQKYKKKPIDNDVCICVLPAHFQKLFLSIVGLNVQVKNIACASSATGSFLEYAFFDKIGQVSAGGDLAAFGHA